MYKAIDHLCFIASAVAGFIDHCLFCFAHFLDVAYTLYTHGINANKSRDRVILSR